MYARSWKNINYLLIISVVHPMIELEPTKLYYLWVQLTNQLMPIYS